MAVPNRKNVIEAVLSRYAHLLIVPKEGNEEPRRRFLPAFIAAMPAEDAGNWGVLRKSTGSVPADILVWKPTNEHFDVSTADEIAGDPAHYRIAAVWKNHGDIKLRNPAWRWMDVREASIPPLLLEDPVDPPSDTHRYNGGGNDTGTCDVAGCGKSRMDPVHATPASRRPHPYDGGEQDTGLCDECGLPRAGTLLHADPHVEPDKPPPAEGRSIDEKLDQLSIDIKSVHDRQDRPLFPVPEDTDGSQ